MELWWETESTAGGEGGVEVRDESKGQTAAELDAFNSTGAGKKQTQLFTVHARPVDQSSAHF